MAKDVESLWWCVPSPMHVTPMRPFEITDEDVERAVIAARETETTMVPTSLQDGRSKVMRAALEAVFRG